jgi:toxin ParE1/3/4
MTVASRDEAISDLDDTARYIAQHNPAAAERTVDKLPLSGRLNRANNTRGFAVPGLPYLIIYLPVGEVVDVVAVFHTSRDPSGKRQP